MIKVKNRDELIKAMRADGMTYREIAERLQCTKQYVYLLNKAMGNTRRYQRDIERIKYQGIYDLFKNDEKMTFSKLQKMFTKGNYNEKLYQGLRQFVVGQTDSCSLTIQNIRNIIDATGMTFEELFKERD